MSIDDPFLDAAIAEADKGAAEGGVPIGAILVADYEPASGARPPAGSIVAAGHNLRVQSGDPTAHAEVVCIRNAGRRRDWHTLTLYTTLSPCPMCTGTVLLFRIPHVVIGENVTFKGDEDQLRQRGVRLTIHNDHRCIAVMRRFITEQRDLWNEDIGLL
jgi:cytosine deaminase